MSLAPNYAVPENVSPFVMLPILTLCRDCGRPLDLLETYSVATDECVVHDLCVDCAKKRAARRAGS